jgi:hypothetical protein
MEDRLRSKVGLVHRVTGYLVIVGDNVERTSRLSEHQNSANSRVTVADHPILSISRESR